MSTGSEERVVRMSVALWFGVLAVAAWAAHWGAEKLSEPLGKLRRQWGLTPVAGAAFLALVTASPEVGINTSSAVQGVSGIGLGNLLGSNIISIPLMVTIAYVASRRYRPEGDGGESQRAGEDPEEHERHLKENLLRLDRRSVTALALPYLAIVALVAALTLPAPWRGLQPVDGFIVLGAYLVYLAQAVLRGRGEGEPVEWTKKGIALALAGVGAIVVGAYFVVVATENLVSIFGISAVVGGLFITSTMSTAPEVFKTWSVAKAGQITPATTSVIPDNAVTMTVAFFPLALVTVPIENFQLYWVNLAFVALMPALYAAFVHWGSEEHGFKRWQVLAFDGAYLLYLAVMLFWVLDVL